MTISATRRFQGCDQSFAVGFAPCLAFPDDKDGPPLAFKSFLSGDVARHVFGEFLLPEFKSCLGRARMFASHVTVPEAAVNKDNDAVAAKDDIRPTR